MSGSGRILVTRLMTWVGLLALLVFAGVGGGAARAQEGTLVVIDPVRIETVRQTYSVLGRLVARRAGQIAARAEGPVLKVNADVGDRVEAGASLVVLDSDRLKAERRLRAAEMAEAQAAIQSAQAERAMAKQAMDRLSGLRKSAAFSQAKFEDKAQELLRAESAVARARAARDKAHANVNLVDIKLRDTVIRAPFPGVVTQLRTQEGAYLRAGDAAVMLVDDSTLEIEADVPADRTGGLDEGVIVGFQIDRRKASSAVVRALIPEENTLTRTRMVRFTPDFDGNGHGLAAHQSVTLLLPSGAERDAVTVHKDAVDIRGGRPTVMLVGKDNKVKRQTIEIGEAVESRFEVLSGLKVDDTVVIRGNERLRPGQKVRWKSGGDKG